MVLSVKKVWWLCCQAPNSPLPKKMYLEDRSDVKLLICFQPGFSFVCLMPFFARAFVELFTFLKVNHPQNSTAHPCWEEMKILSMRKTNSSNVSVPFLPILGNKAIIFVITVTISIAQVCQFPFSPLLQF